MVRHFAPSLAHRRARELIPRVHRSLIRHALLARADAALPVTLTAGSSVLVVVTMPFVVPTAFKVLGLDAAGSHRCWLWWRWHRVEKCQTTARHRSAE